MRTKYGLAILLAVRALAVRAVAADSAWQTHTASGEEFEKQGRYQQAATEFEAARHIAENAPESLELPVTLNNLGVVYRALNRNREAERCYVTAIALFEKHPDLEAPLAMSLENLAVLHLTEGQLSKAAPLYLRSYEIRVRVLPAGHPSIAASIAGLARLEQERDHNAEAEGWYRKALAIQETAPALHNLATVLASEGRFEEARPLLARALELYRAHTPDHPDSAIVLRHLAEIDARAGLRTQADAEFGEALAICDRTLPPDSPQTGIILQAYGRFLNQTKRRKEAGAVMARANGIIAKGMRESGQAWTVDAASFHVQ